MAKTVTRVITEQVERPYLAEVIAHPVSEDGKYTLWTCYEQDGEYFYVQRRSRGMAWNKHEPPKDNDPGTVYPDATRIGSILIERTFKEHKPKPIPGKKGCYSMKRDRRAKVNWIEGQWPEAEAIKRAVNEWERDETIISTPTDRKLSADLSKALRGLI